MQEVVPLPQVTPSAHVPLQQSENAVHASAAGLQALPVVTVVAPPWPPAAPAFETLLPQAFAHARLRAAAIGIRRFMCAGPQRTEGGVRVVDSKREPHVKAQML